MMLGPAAAPMRRILTDGRDVSIGGHIASMREAEGEPLGRPGPVDPDDMRGAKCSGELRDSTADPARYADDHDVLAFRSAA